jgi:iron(III) transport system ATP-binding protein
MSYLRIHQLSKRYSGDTPFNVNELSFSLEKGEILALVGESGSGKTTILRLIAGLEVPDNGSIELGGKILNDNNTFLTPEKRGLGYVFQDYALFPHMTVQNNITYALGKTGNSEKETVLEEVQQLIGLKGYEKRYPHELSGGEQQRVALARAMINKPGLLLLDEPFSNLDFIKKDRVRRRVKEVIRHTKTTAIFVTHDTREALSLADKIIVLKEGKILQVGTPKEIYEKPASAYVAYFFGKVNLFKVQIVDGIPDIPFIDFFIRSEELEKPEINVFIRPENFTIQSTGKNGGIVKQVSYMGNHQELLVQMIHHERAYELVIHAGTEHHFNEGDPINFDLKYNAIQVLSEPGKE